MSNSNLPSPVVKLVTHWRKTFSKAPVTIELKQGDRAILTSDRIQIPLDGCALSLSIEDFCIHFYPDTGALNAQSGNSTDILLMQTRTSGPGVEHFKRLRPDTSLFVDIDPIQMELRISDEYMLSNSTIEISHHGDRLVFQASRHQTNCYVCKIPEESGTTFLLKRRQDALKRIKTIFGGSIKKLDPSEGLSLIHKINNMLALSPYRCADVNGSPGNVLELPDSLVPILIGDLHANIDNLLKVLSENAYLDSLDRGEAALIFLGDAVHSEDPDKLEAMESSLLMMDLIFKLMVQFPNQVFFILGNHDSFSKEIVKSGVGQGLLWENYTKSERGECYQKALEEFYQRSPLIALSSTFVACHAGPPNLKVSKEDLVNVKQNPELANQLLWNRQQSVAFPTGYTRKDVQRFRKSLDLEPDTPFIVGHSPFSQDKTIWCHIGGIRNHHLLTSARPDQVGVFALVNGNMEPVSFTSERLLEWVNRDHPVDC